VTPKSFNLWLTSYTCGVCAPSRISHGCSAPFGRQRYFCSALAAGGGGHGAAGSDAAGLACIGTRVGGIPESIAHDDTGMLVPPKDAPALAQAIIYLLEIRKKRARWRCAAKPLCGTISH